MDSLPLTKLPYVPGPGQALKPLQGTEVGCPRQATSLSKPWSVPEDHCLATSSGKDTYDASQGSHCTKQGTCPGNACCNWLLEMAYLAPRAGSQPQGSLSMPLCNEEPEITQYSRGQVPVCQALRAFLPPPLRHTQRPQKALDSALHFYTGDSNLRGTETPQL